MKVLAVFFIGLTTSTTLATVQDESCWQFMAKIPRIRQFVAKISKIAPSVERKLQLTEFKYTIFAFTNEAYVNAIGSGLGSFLDDSDTLKYHICK